MNKSSAEVATIFGLVILVLGVTSSQTLEGNIEKSNGNGLISDILPKLLLDLLKSIKPDVLKKLTVGILGALGGFDGIDIEKVNGINPKQIKQLLLAILQEFGIFGDFPGLKGIDLGIIKSIDPDALLSLVSAIVQVLGGDDNRHSKYFDQLKNCDSSQFKLLLIEILQVLGIPGGGKDLGNLYGTNAELVKAMGIEFNVLLSTLEGHKQIDIETLDQIEPEQYKALTIFLLQTIGGTKAVNGIDQKQLEAFPPDQFKTFLIDYFQEIGGRNGLTKSDTEQIKQIDAGSFKSLIVGFFEVIGGCGLNDAYLQTISEIDPEQLKTLLLVLLQSVGHTEGITDFREIKGINPRTFKAIFTGVLRILGRINSKSTLYQIDAIISAILDVFGNSEAFESID